MTTGTSLCAQQSEVRSPSRSQHRFARGGAAVAVTGRAAAATAHPLATAAACEVLAQDGSAVDAAIAAQAVICVVMPQAAGLGGDVLALVHHQGRVEAVNGTGCSPASLAGTPPTTGGGSVTVPGLVDGWMTLHGRWGRLPLEVVLARARHHAAVGVRVDAPLATAVAQQRTRLVAGGGSSWSLLTHRASGGTWIQPEVARLLDAIAGGAWRDFYEGEAAKAIVRATRGSGGCISLDDLRDHQSQCPDGIEVPWGAGTAWVQPPTSQGVLLAMALSKVEELREEGVEVDDHVLVEVTEAAFTHRSSCSRGRALLDVDLPVNLHEASRRGGPRSYLHTAGVATVDRRGQVVASLVSVFDDFGSGVFVPELGIVLNNRAAGFTDGDNAPAPGRRPVHTLAPALLVSPEGVLGLATPGADGQVQTLLQVLTKMRFQDASLGEAVAALRWRSQDGRLLVENGHPALKDLRRRGHDILTRKTGEEVFGAVVAAGTRQFGESYAVADWRRQTTSEAVQ